MLLLHASDVAALVGRNRFRPRTQTLLKYLGRIDPQRQQRFMAQTGVEDQEIKADALLRDLAGRHEGLATKMLQMKSRNLVMACSVEAQSSAHDLIATVEEATTDVLTEADAELVKERARSLVYTRYGTDHEVRVAKLSECKWRTQVSKDDVYRRRHLFTDADSGLKVYVGGKCDGVAKLEGRTVVVEIKNRVRRLFGMVPEYERIQLMTYMFIMGLDSGVLVESHDDECAEHEVAFEQAYWAGVAEELKLAVKDLQTWGRET